MKESINLFKNPEKMSARENEDCVRITELSEMPEIIGPWSEDDPMPTGMVSTHKYPIHVAHARTAVVYGSIETERYVLKKYKEEGWDYLGSRDDINYPQKIHDFIYKFVIADDIVNKYIANIQKLNDHYRDRLDDLDVKIQKANQAGWRWRLKFLFGRVKV